MTHTLGNRLKERRTLIGFSQTQLANLTSTTQQRIALWELDKIVPSVPNLLKLCEALDCTPNDLLL